MRIFMLLVLTLFVYGCASKVEEVTVVEYKYVPVELPVLLTKSCVATKPISIEKYTSLNEQERTSYLSKYSIALLGDVKKCDNKLSGLVEYVKKHNEIHLTN